MEQTHEITLDEALADIKQLVKEFPDRTNGGQCYYAVYESNGKRCVPDRDHDMSLAPLVPNCIIGHYLHRKGVDLELFVRHGINENGFDSSSVQAELPLRFEEQAEQFLADVQYIADNGGDGNVRWSEISVAEWEAAANQ